MGLFFIHIRYVDSSISLCIYEQINHHNYCMKQQANKRIHVWNYKLKYTMTYRT